MTTLAPAPVRSTFAPRDVGLLVALALMWGLSFMWIKVALQAFAPLWIVAIRCVIGAAVLLVLLRMRRLRLPRGWRVWVDLVVLAALGNAIPWVLMSLASVHLPSGLVAVINALAPSATLVVAIAVGLERPSVRRTVGLLVALSGTALAVSSSLGVPGTTLAALGVVAATVSYGIGAVYGKRRLSGQHAPLSIAAGQILAAAISMTVLSSFVSPLPGIDEITPSILGALVGLGLFGTGLAFLCYYTLMERVGATATILVTYFLPIVALVAGVIVLGEPLQLVIIAGTALTIVGVWMAQQQRAAPGSGTRPPGPPEPSGP